MSMIKNIFARIWALWGAALFILTFTLLYLPFLSCFLWKEPKRSRISFPLFRVWMLLYLPLIGVKVRLRGKNHFQKNKPYIIICNHRSMMDIPLSSTKVPGANKTIAKIEMSRIPFFGAIYKLGSVLVDRKNKESRRKSYTNMKEVLASGLLMVIYPEGTRNKGKELLTPFHDGAFNLSIECQTPIIPAIITGVDNVLPSGKSFYLLPGTLGLEFLEPVQPMEDTVLMKEKCFTLMKARLEEHKKASAKN